MTQPTTNSIQRAWLRRRRGRVVVGGGVVMGGVGVGGFARAWEPGTRPAAAPRALLAGEGQHPANVRQFILDITNKYARP